MSREAGVVGPTPGEWKVGLECDESGWVDLQAESVPWPHIIGSMRSLYFKTNRANAELVVRAVNSHADLLAALEAMVAMHETGVVSLGAVRLARAAIARATGERK